MILANDYTIENYRKHKLRNDNWDLKNPAELQADEIKISGSSSSSSGTVPHNIDFKYSDGGGRGARGARLRFCFWLLTVHSLLVLFFLFIYHYCCYI